MALKFVDFYKWVVVNDCYRFRRFPQEHFDLIIDVGAATGMFSMLARMLHPRATIVALEPDEIPFGILARNVSGLRIHYHKIALGDGEKRYRVQKDRIGRTMFSPDPTGDYAVDSVRLSDIFATYDGALSKKYYLKIDCEGGEQWLVDHSATEQVMFYADAVGMKLHFPSVDPHSPRWYNEPWAKPWDFYYEWWTRLFTDHDVSYERSSRKTGYGHLLIERKGVL